MRKRFILMLITVSLSGTIMGCSQNKENDTNVIENNEVDIKEVKEESVGEADTFIELGDNIAVEGEGASANGGKVTINKAGTYELSGELADGQVIIDSGDKDKVYIILNGVNITCSNSAPIYVKNADKVIISLKENTENTITDGEKYVYEDSSTDEPNAAIFSKDDMTFIGEGSLTVNSNYNNAIASKDDLEIQGGNYNINSVGDGLRGRDSVAITNGTININSKGDGIKSNNDEDSSKGYVWIKNGALDITAEQDGIQAETKTLISDGSINIKTGGGSENSSKSKDWGNLGAEPNAKDKGQMPQKPNENSNTENTEDTISAKGIKGGANITIDGGKITVDSSDDSIHSNNAVVINNGEIKITSGDDGIHGDSTLDINGGDINITKSYEGIESEIITINDGKINVVASDDGINAAGGNDNSSVNGRPGQNNFAGSGSGKININGGNITVDASGDGLDANGSIYMKNATVIVNGPTSNGNGALDYDGDFEIESGTLIAAGSSGMSQAPGNNSKQKSIAITLSNQEANSIVRIENENGEEVVTFSPSKQYQSIIISSPELKEGSTYNVYTGGNSTGSNINGLYSDGIYKDGAKVVSFKISDVVTKATQEGVTASGDRGMQHGGKGDKAPRAN